MKCKILRQFWQISYVKFPTFFVWRKLELCVYLSSGVIEAQSMWINIYVAPASALNNLVSLTLRPCLTEQMIAGCSLCIRFAFALRLLRFFISNNMAKRICSLLSLCIRWMFALRSLDICFAFAGLSFAVCWWKNSLTTTNNNNLLFQIFNIC